MRVKKKRAWKREQVDKKERQQTTTGRKQKHTGLEYKQ